MLFENDALLLSDDAWTTPDSLYSCWNAKGLYSPLQFVLRLRPDIHRALNAAPAGLVTRHDLTDEQMTEWATRHFQGVYGRNPSDYIILGKKET